MKARLAGEQGYLFSDLRKSVPLQNRRLEVQADRFAAFLLVPSREFFEQFRSQIHDGKAVTPGQISSVFGVSCAAAEIRLSTLNSISGGGPGQQALL